MPRPRPIARWSLLLASLLILATDLASSRFGIAWTSGAASRYPAVPPGDYWMFTLRVGRVGGGWVAPGNLVMDIDDGRHGWRVFRPTARRYWIRQLLINNTSGRRFYLPLWLPFLLLAAPTAYLWLRRRPPPPGHCPCCRYDLRGVPAPICPECGTPIPLCNDPCNKPTASSAPGGGASQ